MGNKARVRVELKADKVDFNDKEDRLIAFKKLMSEFRKACMAGGVQQAYKQHETFESKSRKRRRKNKEAEIARLKIKLRENLLQGKKPNG